MSADVQIFDFNDATVRVVMREGEPWWVAADVCRVLEHSNPSQALAGLDPDERNTLSIGEGNRGNPNANIISESGLYSLIFSSRKPQAKDFKRWVTREVLPAIRRTGGYSVEPPVDAGMAIALLADIVDKLGDRRQIKKAMQEILLSLASGKGLLEIRNAAEPRWVAADRNAFEQLIKELGCGGWMPRAAMERAQRLNILPEVFERKTPHATRSAFGKWIARYHKVRTGSFLFELRGFGNSRRYQVSRLAEVAA